MKRTPVDEALFLWCHCDDAERTEAQVTMSGASTLRAPTGIVAKLCAAFDALTPDERSFFHEHSTKIPPFPPDARAGALAGVSYALKDGRWVREAAPVLQLRKRDG